jgi:hypothetical protein
LRTFIALRSTPDTKGVWWREFSRARGFYVHGGQSQSVQDFERIDSGSLTLTNKRLVFDGSMESRVVDLNKIVSAEVAASDSIQITTNGRMKDSTFTVHNPISVVGLDSING